MTLFYPDDASVPVELRNEEFLLRMLRATDVKLDYDAVIASRAILLVRSTGRWPREGFTIEENLTDLQRHERDHHERTSFTYTVMNPTETECLGCVYINPLAILLQSFGTSVETLATVTDYSAYISFWVRPSCVAVDLYRRLLAALIAWFKQEWAFAQVTFIANQNEVRHLQLFQDTGLRPLYTLTTPKEPYIFYVWSLE
jgi:hypothetical protein